jgi:hypothetical protein
MRENRRIAGLLVALTATVALLLGAGAATSAEPVHGYGIVMGRDVLARTLKINATVYVVTAQTRIKDLEGHSVSFEDLKIYASTKGVAHRMDDATKVKFVAHYTKNEWVLDSVTRIDQLPR